MVPTRRRGTSAASALRVLQDSSIAPSRSFVFGMKWSVTQAMSHPVASRCRQSSSTPDQVWAPMLVNRPKRMSLSSPRTSHTIATGWSCPRLWRTLRGRRRRAMPKIKHIAISTQDVDATAKFYIDVFGMKQIGRVDSPAATGSKPRDDVNDALGVGHGRRYEGNVEVKYSGPDGVMLDVSETGWVGTSAFNPK